MMPPLACTLLQNSFSRERDHPAGGAWVREAQICSPFSHNEYEADFAGHRDRGGWLKTTQFCALTLWQWEPCGHTRSLTCKKGMWLLWLSSDNVKEALELVRITAHRNPHSHRCRPRHSGPRLPHR
ncbi:hypothetical protein H8959_003322, partial [Pygathrix nigripes]